ncbi:MAG: pre-toxin TG domain-containing protein [Pseudobutyrivibrio sp.]|uniref:pre-toxin TG domain-containing protein n=1 Tax=Pseudobutyrivibrio sp. TaxID=2014367 RepID=UPI0025E732E7|nr:pre-toxin TG domain-containing protein [Pseudobutyrivibrio sp.]MBQ6464534.1 pre-toxin TG domain-containing protein [Pseudobutyrivibrio sp.]
MYKSELKKLDDQFENNGITYITPGLDISQHLLLMNSYLADVDDLLVDAELEGISHHDFTNEIDYSNNFLAALLDYARNLKFFALSLLDTPFMKNLRDNAVDKIEKIDINSYSTENTLGIKQRGSFNRATQDFNYTELNAITFENFIVGDSIYDVPEEFKSLTTQFSNYYENVKTSLGDISEEEFLYGLLNKDTPEMQLRKLISAVLDITIIKPLYEAFTGEDIITGQELSEMERGIKFAGAVVGLVTLGTSGILEVPLDQAAQQLGRTLLIDVAATGVSYGTGIICDELDLPVALTVILCVAAGTVTTLTLNGIVYKKVGTGDADLDINNPTTQLEGAMNSSTLENGASAAYNNTAPEIRNIIESHGLTVDEFVELLDDQRVLTDTEAQLVQTIRTEIGLPTEGTLMSKTVPQAEIYKYLNGEYTSVRNFVSVEEHSFRLSGLDAQYEGNRLDYNGTLFKPSEGVSGIANPTIDALNTADTVYGRITYVLDDASSVSYTSDVPSAENAPYTGRGFTASENIVLPEMIQENRPFQTGDVFTVYDAATGNPISEFQYVKNEGWIPIGD